MKKLEAIVIGAGISGASLANVLANKGYQVTVYEKTNRVGGNCFDLYSQDKILYHQYGPHIFHTEKSHVIDFIKQFAKFNGYINKVGLVVNNKHLQLPFNFLQIKKFDPINADAIIKLLKKSFPKQKKVSILELKKITHFEPLNKLVDWLYENVYASYTAKMWGLKISEIDPNVIARVGISLSENESYFPTAKLQGLPIGGYTKMIEKMLNHKNIKVILDTDGLSFLKLEKNNTYWNNVPTKMPIIYCGPIEALGNYRFGYLPYRSLKFVFKTYKQSQFQKFPIINYPLHKSKTRDVEYKQMTLQTKAHRTVISKEYPGQFNPNSQDFNTPYYPIANKVNLDLYGQYLKLVKNYKNLFLLGRLAEYKYYDMDAAIDSALQLGQIIVSKK